MRNPRKINQPKFDVSILKRWLKKKDAIRASAKTTNADRCKLSVARDKVGRYPEMELKLAANVKCLRSLGLPADAHTLKCEAQTIFHELYPRKYPLPDLDSYDHEDTDKGAYPLDFSDRWKTAFVKRNDFSRRKLGSKINKKDKTPGMMIGVQKHHIDCRIFQLSPTPPCYVRDPIYGFTSKKHVFSHDQVSTRILHCTASNKTHSPKWLQQVPLTIANVNEYTIETTRMDEVYDAVMDPTNEKRFCSLNLTLPMDLHDEFKKVKTIYGLKNIHNYPRAHVVFKATKFQTANEWHDQDNRKKGDSSVVVLFQENAWIDTKTHLRGIAEVIGPINEYLGNLKMKGVQFEDNLSSHDRDVIHELGPNSQF